MGCLSCKDCCNRSKGLRPVRKRFLLVPSCRKGNGTGHLRRIISLYLQLKEKADVEIFIPCETVSSSIVAILEEHVRKKDVLFRAVPDANVWDFIVVDKRETEGEERALWSKKGILIGIDEGGAERDAFPFLIDIFPGLSPSSPANITNPSFMELPAPEYRRSSSAAVHHDKSFSILVSYGGEDPERLTEKTVSYLLSTRFIQPECITVVKGPLFGDRCFPEGITVLHAPALLKNMLFRYDIVFTSFGLTAFEAAAAGVKVILFNPSKYHKQLSLKALFFEIGVKEINKSRLLGALQHPDQIPVPSVPFSDTRNVTPLFRVLLALEIPAIQKCPVCGAHSPSGEVRFSDKTYFTCGKCGIEYLVSFTPEGITYKHDYFFSEYRKQYGKTYLEDFEHIRRLSAERLKIIAGKTPGRDILDVGCAYGPFVKEALDSGWNPAGLEIADEAAQYVRTTFGIPVIRGSFEEAVIEKRYDAVTMWFVLEHFKNVESVLAKVNRIVKKGGIFAFSTPNSSGITGKSSRRLFFDQSPGDHFTVWNPRSVTKILHVFGFRVIRVKVTGHHPERFPGFLKGKSGVKRKVMFLISSFFKYGDTFEVYAVKYKEYSP